MDQKKIGILTFRATGVQPWNPDSLKNGIYGAEETVIFMSEALAKIGYQVFVYVEWEENSIYAQPSANPRYVGVNFTEWHSLDIVITWRVPFGAEWLKTHAKQVYFWPHDACALLLTDEEIKHYNNVLWVSHWQREHWIHKNPHLSKFKDVMGNGIDPNQFHPVLNRSNPYSCIYGSNYALGLEVLLDAWPKIKAKFSQATLDIYYGWNHFGLLSADKLSKMQHQVELLSSLGVNEHGQVGQEELNWAYEHTSLWTYPCIGTETFCLTGLRAQFAGAIPVIIEGSALKETVQNGFKCNQREEYCNLLLHVMDKVHTFTLDDRNKMRNFILKNYTWEIVAKKWHALFENDRKKEIL